MCASIISSNRFLGLLLSHHVPYIFSSSAVFSPVSATYPRRLLHMDKSIIGAKPSNSVHSKPSSSFAPSRSGRSRANDFTRGGSVSVKNDRIDALGRLLTKILRHMAVELKLEIGSHGYVRVDDLLKLNLTTHAKVPLKAHTIDDIKEAVKRDNKQRFSLLEESGKLQIRANQGHSIKTVTSENLLKPILSADEIQVCVHGTYMKNLESILRSGLKRMGRLHVHFASGLPTDGEVISGMRRDVNILIFLNVRKALQDGIKLYISDNKVILTEGSDGIVRPEYFENIETWPGRESIPFRAKNVA